MQHLPNFCSMHYLHTSLIRLWITPEQMQAYGQWSHFSLIILHSSLNKDLSSTGGKAAAPTQPAHTPRGLTLPPWQFPWQHPPPPPQKLNTEQNSHRSLPHLLFCIKLLQNTSFTNMSHSQCRSNWHKRWFLINPHLIGHKKKPLLRKAMCFYFKTTRSIIRKHKLASFKREWENLSFPSHTLTSATKKQIGFDTPNYLLLKVSLEGNIS